VSAPPEEFRDSTRLVAGHVAVVAARSPRGGHAHAITATSWTWLSVDPPLLLVCLHEDARLTEALEESESFSVSVLGADPAGRSVATARWLATGGRPTVGQLDRVPHRAGPATGAPLVDGALVAWECRTSATHPGGDHVIVVGAVVGIHRPPPGTPAPRPLLYSGSQYHTTAPLPA
jgi:flavin reductase (DIM6/NTAB) family NADH-FMN oxidoreductase RutF